MQAELDQTLVIDVLYSCQTRGVASCLNRFQVKISAQALLRRLLDDRAAGQSSSSSCEGPLQARREGRTPSAES